MEVLVDDNKVVCRTKHAKLTLYTSRRFSEDEARLACGDMEAELGFGRELGRLGVRRVVLEINVDGG